MSRRGAVRMAPIGPGRGASAAPRRRPGPGALRWAVALLLLAAPAGLARPASGQDEAPEELALDASCVDGGCHTDVTSASHLHWEKMPTECRKCHVQEDEGHEFEVEEGPELCGPCHDLPDAEATLHEPVADGCLDCHDPHGSEAEKLLTESNTWELCIQCHDEEPFEGEFQHGPVESGKCPECHEPHASPNEKLLRKAEITELCIDCHEEVGELVTDSDSPHPPAEDDCTDCHDPHSGPYEYMLPAEKSELCGDCHDDLLEEIEEAEVDHAPVKTRKECLNCHSPHGSDNDSVLLKPQVELCLGCHDEPVKSNDGTLRDIKHWLDDHPEWHQPIQEDGCARCHRPHGGPNFRLLEEPFPRTTYAPYSSSRYELCFSCHKSSLASLERTRKATGFRDGNRNLHFVHVNKKKRGRTCRLCHDMHGADNPLMVADVVRYGRWWMPLEFRRTETGGSCQPGCHEMRSYDRVKPK